MVYSSVGNVKLSRPFMFDCLFLVRSLGVEAMSGTIVGIPVPPTKHVVTG